MPTTYAPYDAAAAERYIGRDLRDLPDPDYTLPLARAYLSVARRMTPHLDLVEATITCGDGSKLWTRYERLLLPWLTPSSEVYVSSVPLIRVVRRCQDVGLTEVVSGGAGPPDQVRVKTERITAARRGP